MMMMPLKLLNLATVPAIVILAGLPCVASTTNGFLYNNDAECTIPFTEVSVGSAECQGNQAGDHSSAKGCYFGDIMSMRGSFVLDQKVNRYFSILVDFCYYGSENAFYKPLRCKTFRKAIDLRQYALMLEEGDQDEQEYHEGFTYESYWQDEERQQWYIQSEQAKAYQAEVEQTYLYPGTYSFNIGLQIPQQSFAFGNGSELRVKLTMLPRESYTLNYYRSNTEYNANIQDSKYETDCYLSFAAIPVDGASQYYDYYTMAGVGILLLGAATYVSSKRRVLCTCNEESNEEAEAWYHAHDIELPEQMDLSISNISSISTAL